MQREETKEATVKIPKKLLTQLCTYFLYDKEKADEKYIICELEKKMESQARRQAYTNYATLPEATTEKDKALGKYVTLQYGIDKEEDLKRFLK